MERTTWKAMLPTPINISDVSFSCYWEHVSKLLSQESEESKILLHPIMKWFQLNGYAKEFNWFLKEILLYRKDVSFTHWK